MSKSLFESTSIGKLSVSNRIVFSSATTGVMDEKLLKQFEGLAIDDVGIILTSSSFVSECTPPRPQIPFYNDSFISPHKDLVETVHKNKKKIVVQLYPGFNYQQKVLGPSAVQFVFAPITPVEATVAEIKDIEADIVKGALRAKAVGYDGIQIHAAHWSLFSLFLNPYYNKRTDEYGGSAENRSRIVLETLTAVRAAVGPDYPIWIKINTQDDTPKDQSTPFQDTLLFAKKLAEGGIDAIEVSGANIFKLLETSETGWFKTEATAVAEAVGAGKGPGPGGKEVSVILTGGNRNYEEMTSLLNSTGGGIGFFGVASPFLKNPTFVSDLKKKAGL